MDLIVIILLVTWILITFTRLQFDLSRILKHFKSYRPMDIAMIASNMNSKTTAILKHKYFARSTVNIYFLSKDLNETSWPIPNLPHVANYEGIQIKN